MEEKDASTANFSIHPNAIFFVGGIITRINNVENMVIYTKLDKKGYRIKLYRIIITQRIPNLYVIILMQKEVQQRIGQSRGDARRAGKGRHRRRGATGEEVWEGLPSGAFKTKHVSHPREIWGQENTDSPVHRHLWESPSLFPKESAEKWGDLREAAGKAADTSNIII